MSARHGGDPDGAGTAPTDAVAGADSPAGATAEDEPEDEITVTREPPQLSRILTLVATAVAVVSTAVFSGLALPFGAVGAVLVTASMLRFHSRRWLTVGIVFVFAGLVLSAALGVLTGELALVGAVATLVAWDAGQFGFSVGDHLGRDARTRRLVVVHTAATTAFLGLMGLVAFGVFRVSGSNQPATAVALLVFGVIALLWTLRT